MDAGKGKEGMGSIYQENAWKVQKEINRAVLGKEKLVTKLMLAVLSGGHVLLEDIPGVGKTTLAIAIAKTMGLDWKRVQFTPDVLPSDLTGFSIYQKEKEAFVYQPGAVFCNLLLADEINRTSPKTQSALLEVMEEGQVTVDGVTRKVMQPFFVIATQNPSGAAGTQPLPPAQMDRFLIRTSMGYPEFDDEVQMAKEAGMGRRTDSLQVLSSPLLLKAMQQEAMATYIQDSMFAYITTLVSATRQQNYLETGASPRATIALVKMAKAMAWLHGQDYVSPAEVGEIFYDVVNHRISLNTRARREKVSGEQILAEILKVTPKPMKRDNGDRGTRHLLQNGIPGIPYRKI